MNSPQTTKAAQGRSERLLDVISCFALILLPSPPLALRRTPLDALPISARDTPLAPASEIALYPKILLSPYSLPTFCSNTDLSVPRGSHAMDLELHTTLQPRGDREHCLCVAYLFLHAASSLMTGESHAEISMEGREWSGHCRICRHAAVVLVILITTVRMIGSNSSIILSEVGSALQQ